MAWDKSELESLHCLPRYLILCGEGKPPDIISITFANLFAGRGDNTTITESVEIRPHYPLLDFVGLEDICKDAFPSRFVRWARSWTRGWDGCHTSPFYPHGDWRHSQRDSLSAKSNLPVITFRNATTALVSGVHGRKTFPHTTPFIVKKMSSYKGTPPRPADELPMQNLSLLSVEARFS